jgi:hypothetical protein
MTTSRYLVASAATAAVVLLAACSSSAGGSPPNPPGGGQSVHTTSSTSSTGSTTGASSETTAAAPATSGAKPDVCAAMPAATLASLTGLAITKSATRDDPHVPQSVPISIGTCIYTGGAGVQLDITVARTSFAAHLFDTDYSTNKQVLSKTALVPGIGDKAFTANFASMWLEVLWGDEQLEIDGASAVSVPVAKRVLTAVHDKV